MDQERWERVQSVFHDVLDRPEPERAEFLKAACGGDDGLRPRWRRCSRRKLGALRCWITICNRIAHQVLDAPLKSLPLEQFGPYRIKRLLGEGGMGVVYLAEREDLGSQVAIKVLRDAWLSPARMARFESEQKTLASLNHPSIARLYDADCLENGTPWFAMEFVDGAPITDYCRQRECSIEERLRLFHAVCEAVQYAHSQAIIHRDLKPSNLFVKSDGTVKLLDFGIAKHLENLDAAAEPDANGAAAHDARLCGSRAPPKRPRRHRAPTSIPSASSSMNYWLGGFPSICPGRHLPRPNSRFCAASPRSPQRWWPNIRDFCRPGKQSGKISTFYASRRCTKNPSADTDRWKR